MFLILKFYQANAKANSSYRSNPSHRQTAQYPQPVSQPSAQLPPTTQSQQQPQYTHHQQQQYQQQQYQQQQQHQQQYWQHYYAHKQVLGNFSYSGFFSLFFCLCYRVQCILLCGTFEVVDVSIKFVEEPLIMCVFAHSTN